MPWSTKKVGNRWAIIRSDTGKVVGYADTEEKAKASVRARYANYNPKDASPFKHLRK